MKADAVLARTMSLALQDPLASPASRLAALLRRVATRDREAFASLYHASSAKLYGVIVRILRRRDIADEVLQDVYLQIWERAVHYDATKGSPITWMATIARNRALDEVRRKTALSIEDVPEAFDVADGREDPLDTVARGEELQRLRRCLDGLAPEQRDLVLLAYREGMSREALARRFSRPEGTIKTWLRRSLGQLRECLDR